MSSLFLYVVGQQLGIPLSGRTGFRYWQISPHLGHGDPLLELDGCQAAFGIIVDHKLTPGGLAVLKMALEPKCKEISDDLF